MFNVFKRLQLDRKIVYRSVCRLWYNIMPLREPFIDVTWPSEETTRQWSRRSDRDMAFAFMVPRMNRALRQVFMGISVTNQHLDLLAAFCPNMSLLVFETLTVDQLLRLPRVTKVVVRTLLPFDGLELINFGQEYARKINDIGTLWITEYPDAHSKVVRLVPLAPLKRFHVRAASLKAYDLTQFANNCPNVEELELIHGGFNSVSGLQSLKHLKVLHLKKCVGLAGLEDIFGRKYPTLVTLKLHGNKIPTLKFLEALTGLRHLWLQECWPVNHVGLSHLSQNAPLISLNIIDTGCSPSKVINVIIWNQYLMEDIRLGSDRIRSTERIKSQLVKTILETIPTVTVLHIMGDDLDDQVFDPIGIHGSQLQDVRILSTKCTASGVSRLIEHRRTLLSRAVSLPVLTLRVNNSLPYVTNWIRVLQSESAINILAGEDERSWWQRILAE